MGDTENLLVQIKVNHHQLVGDFRVEGQIQDEGLLIRLSIHPTAEPLEPQKVHHLGKGQLGRVGPRKELRRDVRGHLIPVELHEISYDAVIGVALIRQRRDPNAVNKLRAYFALAHLFLFGYRVKERQIERLEGSHFEIETGEGVVWNFDGEKGISGKVTVDVLPGKINMLVPRGRKV